MMRLIFIHSKKENRFIFERMNINLINPHQPLSTLIMLTIFDSY